MLETIKIADENNRRGWVIINKSDMKDDDIAYDEKNVDADKNEKKPKK